MNIRIEKNKQFTIAGFKANTKEGFQIIGECWDKLNKVKEYIPNRLDKKFLVTVNDYTNLSQVNNMPCFDYYVGAEVTSKEDLLSDMIYQEFVRSDYLVFSFVGNPQDSLEEKSRYIYQEYLPRTGHILNDIARYDIIRYSEVIDEKNNTLIECYVPIIK